MRSFGLLVALVGYATPSLATPSENEPVKVFVADGGRVRLQDKGFSIVPPAGWEVTTGGSGVSIMMQAPREGEARFQGYVQVLTFNEPRAINDATRAEFANLITRKYAQMPAAQHFKIRNNVVTQLGNGTPAILYYSDFQVAQDVMMQAHIVVASAKRHYVLTYTDFAANFQGELATRYLTPAWTAMTSMEVEGGLPAPAMSNITQLGLGLLALLLLFVLFSGLRSLRAVRRYDQFSVELSDETSREEKRLTTHSSHPPGSEPGSTFNHSQGQAFSSSEGAPSSAASGRGRPESDGPSKMSGFDPSTDVSASEQKKSSKGKGFWEKKADDKAAASAPGSSAPEESIDDEPVSKW